MGNVKVTRWFIIIFIIAVAIAFIFFGALCTNQTMKIFFVGDAFKNLKEDIYNIENRRVGKDAVVFLGDSITEMYDVNKHYKDTGLNIVNRGVSSETSDEVLERLTMNVMSLAPSKVILLVGTNDLNKGATEEEIVNNIIKIATNIRSFNDDTEIYVESILPVNNKAYLLSKSIVHNRSNESIRNINAELEANARYFDYTYIDTFSALKDENGNLKKEYSVDGLHISRAGYAVMTKTIKTAVGM